MEIRCKYNEKFSYVKMFFSINSFVFDMQYEG